MSSNISDQNAVHLGSWTNWSRGSTLGATLTLTRSDANLLIAFFAFFVAYVGIRGWRIACLAAHFIYSSNKEEDGLYHQRQAILRNSANAEAGLAALVSLLHAWRKHARRPVLRLLIVLFMAVIFVVGFVMASGFSSRVSTTEGSEVLLAGSNCMIMDWNRYNMEITPAEYKQFAAPYSSKLISNAANYAQQCYGANGSTILGCNKFVQTRLPLTVTNNASCPFDEKMCRLQTGNLVIDTGLLDSHEHLGINAPPSDRWQWRRVLTCAPLVTEGYTTQFNLSADRSYTRYSYGNRTDQPGHNYTYEFSNDGFYEFRAQNLTSASGDYAIGIVGNIIWNNTYPSYLPLPELATMVGDISLYFLSAPTLIYLANITDPWYRATTPAGFLGFKSSADDQTSYQNRQPAYRQDEPASPLACVNQEQYCNPNASGDQKCTALQRTSHAYASALRDLFADPDAYNRLAWSSSIAFSQVASVADVASTLGSEALTSRSSLNALSLASIQGALPDNQWQLDVQHWFETSLAVIQTNMITVPNGPSDEHILEWSRGPQSAVESTLCNSQKILSDAYVSFSIFGIAFTFGLGGLIVLVSYLLDPLMACLRRRWRVREYQQLEWRTNGTLQLQRLAHEELGYGGAWRRATQTVPVTGGAAETLAVLDVADRKHPRLRAAPPADGAVSCSPDGGGAETTEQPAGNCGGPKLQTAADFSSLGGAPMTRPDSLEDAGSATQVEHDSEGRPSLSLAEAITHVASFQDSIVTHLAEPSGSPTLPAAAADSADGNSVASATAAEEAVWAAIGGLRHVE